MYLRINSCSLQAWSPEERTTGGRKETLGREYQKYTVLPGSPDPPWQAHPESPSMPR